jgi:DNA-binding LacI/PurR family transcriptional regulator
MVKTSVITIRTWRRKAVFLDHALSQTMPPWRYIPPATKKRIEKAAKKLGYRPNLFARLRSKRSHTVGVMVFDMTGSVPRLFCAALKIALSVFLSADPDRRAQRTQPV